MRHPCAPLLITMTILCLTSNGMASSTPSISSLAALVDGLIEVASTRELPWTTLSAQHLDDGSFLVSLSAPARLHQFAPLIAMSSGSAHLERDGAARACRLSFRGAPPNPAPVLPEALLRALEVLDTRPERGGSIFYTWSRGDIGNLDVNLQFPVDDLPAKESYADSASWAPLQSMRIEKRPTEVAVEMRSQVVSGPSSSRSGDVVVQPTWETAHDPSSSLTGIRTSPIPRHLLVEEIYRFVRATGPDLRALAITIDEQEASFTASWLRSEPASSAGKRR